MNGPLDGIKVLDFSQMMQGPWAAQMLGDMGAEVIKIERPVVGEKGRSAGHYSLGKEKIMFLSMNRNKKSLCLDLKKEEGLKIAYKLISISDVLIENFRPGVMDRLGLGYQKVNKINPRIIYGSASGFGPKGPMSKKKGQDLIAQALSGLLSITGGPDDPPTPVGTFVSDQHSATLLAFGIVSALFYRERTKKGQHVEVDLLSSSIDLQPQEISAFLNANAPTQRSPERGHIQLGGPYGVYKAKDGYLVLSEVPMADLAGALDLPYLPEKYPSSDVAYQRRDEVAKEIQKVLTSKTVKEWIEILEKYDCWCAPVYDYKQALNNPQLKENKMIVEVEHPIVGKLKYTGIPVRLSDTPASIRSAAPLLGEHTNEILERIGYSTSEISGLKNKGII